MEYVIIFFFQIFGILFHVGQKIAAIRNNNRILKVREVFAIFWHEDWNTLGLSGVVLLFDLFVHFVVDYVNPGFYDQLVSIPLIFNIVWITKYLTLSFLLALILGYGGQWLIYKYLGTAVKVAEKLADDKIKSLT